MNQTLAIIIPAFNEEGSICEVIKSIPNKIEGISKIITIVVDDGSKDRTYKIAKTCANYVVKHIINLGVGAATLSGLNLAKKLNIDITLTIDGDGQHSSQDIIKVLRPVIEKKADVVIGTRILNIKHMPHIKVFGNWLLNALTFVIFHKWTNDSQSGMRAFSKAAVKKMKLDSIGYEVSSEIIGEVKRNKLKMTEIPITTIYTDYSRLKGQSWINGVNILTKSIYIRLSKLK
jgi:glycosyltransferase involved in cell wall biosynthesis